MKKSILITTALLLSIGSFSQEKNVVWLDSTLEPVKKRHSSYRMEVVSEGSLYSVNTFDNDNNKFMEAKSRDRDGKLLNGKVVFYYPNGQVQSKGQYIDGSKVGLWQRFDVNGLEKAERVYDIYDAKIRAYKYVDEMPQFQGGQENFDDFLKLSFSHYVQPSADKGQRLVFSFIINENGNLENPKVTECSSDEAQREILEILSNMPQWIPGKKQGEKVRVYFEKEIYCN